MRVTKRRSWVWDEVLLCPDLLPLIVDHLRLCDREVAAVCRVWRRVWTQCHSLGLQRWSLPPTHTLALARTTCATLEVKLREWARTYDEVVKPLRAKLYTLLMQRTDRFTPNNPSLLCLALVTVCLYPFQNMPRIFDSNADSVPDRAVPYIKRMQELCRGRIQREQARYRAHGTCQPQYEPFVRWIDAHSAPLLGLDAWWLYCFNGHLNLWWL